MTGFDRRELLLTALAGSSSMLLPGCSQTNAGFTGELLSPSLDVGHRIRDGDLPEPAVTNWQESGVVIVGGGISGLAAAWRLHHAGVDNFTLLELETVIGGTSRCGQSRVSGYPWGAHYVPVPRADNRALWRLLDEMGVAAQNAQGVYSAHEHILCREPHERLFVQGHWAEGLYPHSVATDEDLRQWTSFQERIAHWIDWRDARGTPAFTIPLAGCSADEAVIGLDEVSMGDWMRREGWDSVPLFWWVDYCCRDDYGLTIEQTSAWAGLFYFASRRENSNSVSPGVLTWPEGNGRIVRHLSRVLGSRVNTGQAVLSIQQSDDQTGRVRIVVLDRETKQVRGIRAQQVIFAAPQFLARYLILNRPAGRVADSDQFQYGAWVGANVHLSDRPQEPDFPLSWDNVIHDSPSLGYVVATHQQGIDHGPTVWTWYLPLCDDQPSDARRKLLDLTWEHWAEIVITDLERAHPDARDLVTRVDVMRWGHAMIQARPGFIWSRSRQRAATAEGAIHFAGTDLSGIALMEEAFYHGIRAAEEVLTVRDALFSSFL
ncbi:MAG: FAD-dependent oxidoreductase [Fuerstiella sp.]|nr:FAD-dependent oxidoreductase [Fuerstiella sp.]